MVSEESGVPLNFLIGLGEKVTGVPMDPPMPLEIPFWGKPASSTLPSIPQKISKNQVPHEVT